MMLPNRITLNDLVEHDMFDFDIILGIELLHACFASISFKTRVVMLQFPNEPILELKGGNSIARVHIISCLKACKMISKGCLYHIVRFKDLDSENTPIELVPVVRKFL